MHRAIAYVVAVLLAVILTILPAALWPDMAMPMEDNWENWYWKGQPHPRPAFSLQNPPRLFAAEVRLYKALVAPPAYLSRALTGWPTSYACFFITPYRETGIPPFAMALEHSCWAFPLWLAVLIIVVESWRLIRRVLRQRRPAVAAILVLAGMVILLGCRAVDPPVRPSNVPPSAVWAGGADGGAWIACEFGWKEPYVTYICDTFTEHRQPWSKGAYVLVQVGRNPDGSRQLSPLSALARVASDEYVAFDGVDIQLKHGRLLTPHSEIDFPFGDDHGKRATYQLGRETASEVQY